MSEYEFVTGDWELPAQKNFKLACCDCGLVHTIDFRVRDREVEWRINRDNRATGQIRRHMKEQE